MPDIAAWGFADRNVSKRFARTGYEVVTLFSCAEVSRLEAAYSAFSAAAPSFHATMYSLDAAYRQSVYELLRPFVMGAIGSLLPGYTVRVANWVVKEAGQADSTVSFHQDWSFVDERQHRSINLWFPLIDVDDRNGCLEVVPRSHLVSKEPRPHGDRCRFDELMPEIRARYRTSIPMQAGQALLYDGALLHGSSHNRSVRRRIAVGTVLTAHDTVLLHASRVSPTEVELFGVDDAFFWQHAPGTRPAASRRVGAEQSLTVQHGADVLDILAGRWPPSPSA